MLLLEALVIALVVALVGTLVQHWFGLPISWASAAALAVTGAVVHVAATYYRRWERQHKTEERLFS